MAEILPIRRKTQFNQSNNQTVLKLAFRKTRHPKKVLLIAEIQIAKIRFFSGK